MIDGDWQNARRRADRPSGSPRAALRDDDATGKLWWPEAAAEALMSRRLFRYSMPPNLRLS